MEDNRIRTERRFGVTAHLDNSARMRIMQIRNSQGWDDLLDCFEQTIIEMETVFTNMPAHEEAAVLAHHKKIQAAWQMFEQLQRKVDEECAIYLQETTPPAPRTTTDDAGILNIVEPFNEYDEETQ